MHYAYVNTRVVSKYGYLYLPGVVARAAEGISDQGPEQGEVSLSLESRHDYSLEFGVLRKDN